MFVVVAFLVHSVAAHGELALPDPGIAWWVTFVLMCYPRFRLSLIRNVRLVLKDSQLLLVSLWALHDVLLRKVSLLTTFAVGIVCVVSVVLSSPTGHSGMPRTFVIRGLVAFRCRLFRILPILVRCPGAADPFRIWVFLGHRYRSCW